MMQLQIHPLFGIRDFRSPQRSHRKPILGGRYKIRRVAVFDIRPWRAWTTSELVQPRSKRFATHAEALTWANERVRSNNAKSR